MLESNICHLHSLPQTLCACKVGNFFVWSTFAIGFQPNLFAPVLNRNISAKLHSLLSFSTCEKKFRPSQGYMWKWWKGQVFQTPWSSFRFLDLSTKSIEKVIQSEMWSSSFKFDSLKWKIVCHRKTMSNSELHLFWGKNCWLYLAGSSSILLYYISFLSDGTLNLWRACILI